MTPFDTEALRQWAAYPAAHIDVEIPAEQAAGMGDPTFVVAVGLVEWNQMVADLQAAADHIDMLEDRDPEETS